MISPIAWALFLGVLITIVAPAGAQCDPSHAVVAVASVLSTLAVVTIVLIGIYFFLSRRRRGNKVSKNVYEVKKKGDGHNNYAFTENENFAALEGVTTPRRRGQSHFPEQVLSGGNKSEEAWPSPARSGRLYRKGSLGSLDETAKFVDSEVISVTLESQDIIGLGFNICGNFGDGILVSEVHNRGPAKESGNIQIGDRILSVAVSYENIVYEDALTILSYASPYPVKIILEKATEVSHNFEDEKQTGNHTRRIMHPLFRSRSLDTLKHVTHSEKTAHPKRAVSDLKLESVKYFLNWRSKNSKRGNMNSHKNGTSFDKKVTLQRDMSAEEATELDETFYGNKTPGYGKLRQTLQETVAEVTPASDVNTAENNNHQKSYPGKPERKARRERYLQNMLHLEENQVTPSTRRFAYTISSVTDDEIDVDEIDIDEILDVPTTSSYDKDMESSGSISQFEENTETFTLHHNLDMPIPTKADQSDETTTDTFIGIDTLFPTIPNDSNVHLHKPSNNNSKESTALLNPPIVDKDTLNKLTAINPFATDTQGLSVIDGGRQDDSMRDFTPSQPEQKSNGKILSNEITLHKPPDGELTVQENPFHSNSNFAFEAQDDLATGNPFAAEISKHMVRQTELTQHPDKSSNDASYSTILPTSVSFLNNKTSSHSSNSSTGSPENTDESETSDILEWSGKRLVRSESFSNIFVDD